jgi:antitoxin MazE
MGDMKGADMRTVVRKRGNSASIRIPSAVLEAAKIEIDVPVDIREERGRIVIEPLRPTSCDLADLVKKITADNLHDEVDFGRPVGRELSSSAPQPTTARRA